MDSTISIKKAVLGSLVVIFLLALMVFFNQQVKAAPPDRAVALEGVSDAEISTNALFPLTGDLVTVSGLSIPPKTTIYAEFVARTGPGNNIDGKIGLRLNNTVVLAPISLFSQLGNDDGFYTVKVGPALLNYGGMCYMSGTSALVTTFFHRRCDSESRRPSETITDFTIIGSVNDSALTIYASELRVYAFQENP